VNSRQHTHSLYHVSARYQGEFGGDAVEAHRGLGPHVKEQAHVSIPKSGIERDLLRATLYSCLPQGRHQGPSER
jgi:hypothetical protein